tara:strand:- start:1437 stop:2093 length:657 start_codon:yes stop_codon:yes gene_type:complete
MASAKEQAHRRYLEAMLRHVSFDGWSVRALKRAASDLGEELDVVHQALPGGAVNWVGAFVKAADQDMLEALAQQDLNSVRIRERIAFAVRLRIDCAAPHREAVRRGVAVHALPFNAGYALRSLYGTVDTIWAGIGDTSTDFNFYTKRALLAGVYSSTLLYWLDDHSDSFADTWSFLDRRIENVMGIQKVRGRIDSLAEKIGEIASRGAHSSLWRRRPA